MFHQKSCDYMFRIISTTFIMTVTATFDQNIQPFGPLMCKRHCAQITKDTFCIFLIKSLTCVATLSKYPPQMNGEDTVYLDTTKETLGSISHRKGLCAERYLRIVLTRLNGLRCVPPAADSRGTTGLELRSRGLAVKTELASGNREGIVLNEPVVSPSAMVVKTEAGSTSEQRIVFIEPLRNGKRTTLQSFHLGNTSITAYHHIKLKDVTAMAYVPTPRQVLVATVHPKNLQTYSLHSDASVSVMRGKQVLSIVVDDAKQLVFLNPAKRPPCFTTMKPDGRYVKDITCQINVYLLCLDTRRELVYAAHYQQIYSFRYDGKGQKLITKARRTMGMALADGGGVMYFNEGLKLIKIQLEGKTTKRNECLMTYDSGNILYSNDYLSIFRMYESNFPVTIVKYRSKYSTFHVILIPQNA